MDTFITWQFLLLAAVINATCTALKRATPKNWAEHRFYKPVLTVLPLLLGVILGTFPKALGVEEPWFVRAQLGLLAGSVSASAYHLFRSRLPKAK